MSNRNKIYWFLPYLSICKTGCSLACAKAIHCLQPKILGITQETRLLGFAQYFAYWTNTLKPRKFCTNHGYVALVTVLVIGVVMLAIGMAVVLNSINGGQGSLGGTKNESGIGFVESCAEDALLSINNDNALGSTIVLPDGSCTVTMNSQSGGDWDFTVTGTLEGYTKSIRVTATRGSTVIVNSWQEI